MMHALGDETPIENGRQRRHPTSRQDDEKRDNSSSYNNTSSSDEYNSDEKKESDGSSPTSMLFTESHASSLWQQETEEQNTINNNNNNNNNNINNNNTVNSCSIAHVQDTEKVGLDQACENSPDFVESPTTSFTSLEDLSSASPINNSTNNNNNNNNNNNVIEPVASSGSGSGLHHRHHHFQNNHHATGDGIPLLHSPERLLTQMSPNRRRIKSRPTNKSYWGFQQFRKRRWSVVQLFRILLVGGITFYLVILIRGMLLLFQHNNNDTNDANNNNKAEPDSNSLLSELMIGLPFSHPQPYSPQAAAAVDIHSHYLRAGGHLSLPLIGSPISTYRRTTADPNSVKRALQQRVSERQSRTRPPIVSSETDAASLTLMMEPYEILPPDKYPRRSSILKQQSPALKATQSALANVTQLCGLQAQKASRSNPGSFLQKDVLNQDARVIITGILSNPIAFHLALTLIAQCGVEVLIGIDPMLPNTVQNRMKLVDQMKILAANAPKMVQPILVPLMGIHPRVKKSKKGSSSEQSLMLRTTGEIDLMNFNPTHIVHLSSAAYQSPRTLEDATKKYPLAPPKRPLSPYQISEHDHYEPALFQIRSSMTGMEQILASIVSSSQEKGGNDGNGPHFVYASAPSTMSSKLSGGGDTVHSKTKLMDEVLADTYHSLFGTYSVGMRIPPNGVYGPWDHEGTDMYKLLEGAVQNNASSYNIHNQIQELVYVQDAVEAILAAMQYRGSEATSFDMTANAAVSLSDVSSAAHSFLTTTLTSKPITVTSLPSSLPDRSRTVSMLQWSPQTPLRDGILRTLAWHLDRESPYGYPSYKSHQPSSNAPSTVTGDALLLRNSISTCAADDVVCHAGPAYLPCASECSTKAQCMPSIFDPVRELSRNMTEGCDAVLYTQSLGQNVEDLQLQSQFEDDVEPAICNLAFVARGSPLVKAVIEKIPNDELLRLGVRDTARFTDKLDTLNGRLLYRGWILIWVDHPGQLSPGDSSLMKLSPGRMFAGDVLYAVFVEENFTVSPTTDDVRFLISQMDRGATKQRNIYRMMKDENSKSKKVKFTIPAQPEKRASILLSQLKFKISDRGRIPQDTKISIMDAVRFMRFEVGEDPTKVKESTSVRLQKDFYRRIPTFVNGKDLRDNFEPLYKYDLGPHYARTRWVVHDLTLEESRNLRCDWYQEHVQWGTDLDQLSFAAVMATKVLQRRIMLLEPDDRSKQKSSVELPPEIKDITDNNEWIPMATEQNKINFFQQEHTTGVEQIHDAVTKDETEEDGTEDEPEISTSSDFSPEKKPDTGLYVRIISDRIMSLSRKAWQRYRAELSQQAS